MRTKLCPVSEMCTLAMLMALTSIHSSSAGHLPASLISQQFKQSSQLGQVGLCGANHWSRIRGGHQFTGQTVSNSLRGGSDDHSSYYGNNYAQQGNYNSATSSSATPSGISSTNQVDLSSQIPQQPSYQQPYADREGEFIEGYSPDQQFYQGQRESVEDRLAAWRLQQQVR